MILKPTYIFSFLFLFLACQETKQKTDIKESTLSPNKKLNVEQVSEDSLRFTGEGFDTDHIAVEGSIYEFQFSPDSQFIAINNRVLSGLDVALAYPIDKHNGSINHSALNLSRLCWDSLSKREGFDPGELQNPRSRLVGWEQKTNQAKVSVNGIVKGGKEIEDTLLINLSR